MDLLRKIVASPTVRKALVGLVLAVLAAAGVSLGTGCGAASLPPAVAKAQARLECQLAALETVVPRDVALDLAKAVRAGQTEYVVQQLLGLGVTPAAIRAAADAFNACSAQDAPAAPTVEPS